MNADGWYFVTTAEGGAEEDPVSYRLEISESLSGSWREVAAPPWWLRSVFGNVPTARGSMVIHDLRPTWQWVLERCCGLGIVFLGCLMATIQAAQGHGRRAAQLLAVTWGVFSLLSLCIAICNTVMGTEIEDNLLLLQWFVFVELAIVTHAIYAERYILDVMLLVCPAFGATMLLREHYYFNSTVLPVLTENIPYFLGALPAFSAAVLLIARSAAGRWVRDHLLAEDRQAYKVVWDSVVMADAANGGALRLLAARTRVITAALSPEVVRQRHRLRLISSSSSSGWASEIWRSSYLRRGASGVVGPVRPRVRSASPSLFIGRKKMLQEITVVV